MPNLHLLGIIDEDFVNYKVPSMVLEFPICDFKCNKDAGRIVCQNMNLTTNEAVEISIEKVCQRYYDNPITEAVVCQGFEPMDSFPELYEFIKLFRQRCHDDIVIYTGYNKDEILDKISILKKYLNIIIKYGRYVPDQATHFDEILGVKLASGNQYAERIG